MTTPKIIRPSQNQIGEMTISLGQDMYRIINRKYMPRKPPGISTKGIGKTDSNWRQFFPGL